MKIEKVEGSTVFVNVFKQKADFMLNGELREKELSFHVREREGGSFSFYYTQDDGIMHNIVFDTLDGEPNSFLARLFLKFITAFIAEAKEKVEKENV